jgi:hypothetical protein
MVARQIPVTFRSFLKVTRSSRVRVISFCAFREAGGDVSCCGQIPAAFFLLPTGERRFQPQLATKFSFPQARALATVGSINCRTSVTTIFVLLAAISGNGM